MHFPHWERKHTLISSYYLHNQKINIWSALRNKPSNQLITLIFSFIREIFFLFAKFRVAFQPIQRNTNSVCNKKRNTNKKKLFI